MSIPMLCETCFVPDHLPEVSHAPWCPGMKQLKKDTEELRKKYEELKTAHDTLRRNHDALAKSVQPAISASIVYGSGR